MLVAFFHAQHINLHSGGAVIAPWDLLDGFSLDDWVEAAAMLSRVPAIRRRFLAQKKVFEAARRKHKDYARLHRLKRIH